VYRREWPDLTRPASHFWVAWDWVAAPDGSIAFPRLAADKPLNATLQKVAFPKLPPPS